MTDAEDLALRGAAAAVDRDVVRGGEARHHAIGIYARRHLDRREGGARRRFDEDAQPQGFGPGAGRTREPIVTPENVGESLRHDHAEHLAQPDHDRHGRREACLVLGGVLPLLGEIEIEPRRGRARHRAPRPVAQRDDAEPGWQHETLLRRGHDDVDAPRVHLQVRDAKARDGIDDQHRIGGGGRLCVRAHVVEYTRRRFAVLDEHRLHVRVRAQRLGDALGSHRLAVRRRELDDLQPVRLGNGQPALRERARVDDDHTIAGRQRVGHRRFHCAGPRARRREHLLLRLDQALESRADLGEEGLVLRRAMVDDRPRHRQQHFARHRRRSRRHQLILLHSIHDLLVGAAIVVNPSTPPAALAAWPSATTKIASWPAARGWKKRTTSSS